MLWLLGLELGFGFFRVLALLYVLIFIMKFLRRRHRGGRQFAEPHKFLFSLCMLII